MKLRKVLAENVITFRKQREYNQDELAKLLKVNKQTIYRIEAGTTNVGLDTLEQLGKALKVEPAELLRQWNQKSNSPEHVKSFDLALKVLSDGVSLLKNFRSSLKD